MSPELKKKKKNPQQILKNAPSAAAAVAVTHLKDCYGNRLPVATGYHLCARGVGAARHEPREQRRRVRSARSEVYPDPARQHAQTRREAAVWSSRTQRAFPVKKKEPKRRDLRGWRSAAEETPPPHPTPPQHRQQVSVRQVTASPFLVPACASRRFLCFFMFILKVCVWGGGEGIHLRTAHPQVHARSPSLCVSLCRFRAHV